MPYRQFTLPDAFPRTWLGRVLASLAAVVIVVVGFFFLTIALAVLAVALLVIVIRVLWAMRRLRREAERGVIEVEYSVDAPSHDPRLPKNPSDRR